MIETLPLFASYTPSFVLPAPAFSTPSKQSYFAPALHAVAQKNYVLCIGHREQSSLWGQINPRHPGLVETTLPFVLCRNLLGEVQDIDPLHFL